MRLQFEPQNSSLGGWRSVRVEAWGHGSQRQRKGTECGTEVSREIRNPLPNWTLELKSVQRDVFLSLSDCGVPTRVPYEDHCSHPALGFGFCLAGAWEPASCWSLPSSYPRALQPASTRMVRVDVGTKHNLSERILEVKRPGLPLCSEEGYINLRDGRRQEKEKLLGMARPGTHILQGGFY